MDGEARGRTSPPMTGDPETEAWGDKDGRAWRIGGEAEVACIRQNTAICSRSRLPVSLRCSRRTPPWSFPGPVTTSSASALEAPDRHNAGRLRR